MADHPVRLFRRFLKQKQVEQKSETFGEVLIYLKQPVAFEWTAEVCQRQVVFCTEIVYE